MAFYNGFSLFLNSVIRTYRKDFAMAGDFDSFHSSNYPGLSTFLNSDFFI